MNHPRRLPKPAAAFTSAAVAARVLATVAALVTASGPALAPAPALAKALLGEPEVDRASDQFDNHWCPAEQLQMYEGTFLADGPEVTLVFIASNVLFGNYRRERIDNVIVVPASEYAAHTHLPDSAFAAAVNCIEPHKEYFHFSDVPPAQVVFLEKFAAGIPAIWDMTDGAYYVPNGLNSSAPNAYALPLDVTGGAMGLGVFENPVPQATTEVTFSGLTADEAYVVSTWTGCVDASVGPDLLIQVYGTEFFKLAASQPSDVSPGRGLAWGDADSDGDLDVYVANFNTASKYWRNDGGVWADGTAAAGLALTTSATAVAWADPDDDGDLDLYVGSNGANRYFRNQGNGTFVNATAGPLGDARKTETLDWADYDNDGDLDLFLGNVETDALLRNDGAAFVDVANGSLLGSGTPTGCSFVDYDGDSDPDLFVTYSSQANELFVNQNGAFVKQTPAILALAGVGTTAAWADYDNDGDLDVYFTVVNADNRLLRNNGNGSFTEVTPRILAAAGNNVESIWGDFDNDGLLDLHLVRNNAANILFQNKGDDEFVRRNTGAIENAGIGAGAAFGDADEDGDADLFVVNVNTIAGGLPDVVYTNEFGDERGWLEVDLQGVVSNRSGVGAKIYVAAGGKTQMREVGGETGCRSQNSLTADFGLGSPTLTSVVTVKWPSGITQNVPNVAPNQRIVLIEGQGGTDAPAHGLAAAGTAVITLHPNVPNPFANTTSIGWELSRSADAALRIYDVAGRVVRTLLEGPASAGPGSVMWNGRDDAGRPVAPGIYFYEFRAGEESTTRKLVRVE